MAVEGAASPQLAGDARVINSIETGKTMAADRKNAAPKRRATNARRGRPPVKSAQPKAAAPARPKTPHQKVAQKATPGRTQTRRTPSNRAAPHVDAGLAGQLESMTQELGQIRETCSELKDLRRLVETLTGMVEGLVASQRVQIGSPEQEVTSAEHRSTAQDAEEPDAADDRLALEPPEPTPSDQAG